jgi:hypothetical protein
MLINGDSEFAAFKIKRLVMHWIENITVEYELRAGAANRPQRLKKQGDDKFNGATMTDADDDTIKDNDELVWGADAISRIINRTERQTFHLLKTGAIKSVKKVGGRYAGYPSALRREFGGRWSQAAFLNFNSSRAARPVVGAWGRAPTRGETQAMIQSAPVFVCRFSDGVVTRMTTHCTPDNLDLQRGITLARIAYRSRTKGNDPPPIAEARFQTQDGVVLCEYDDRGGHMTAATQSIVRLDRTTDREKPCSENLAVIHPGKGPRTWKYKPDIH